jgi:filamin
MSEQDKAGKELRSKQQEVQRKTFLRWCNVHLKDRGIVMTDLVNDMKDGVALINLLEIISGKSLAPYNKTCRVVIHRMENLTKSLKFLGEEGIKLVNIAPSDIESGNLTCVLGLVWTLILRYQIQKGKHDEEKGNKARSELLEWVNSRINPKRATNFTTDWQNGDFLSTLQNSLVPGSVQPTGDALRDTEAAMAAAEEKLKIPRVMDASDLVNNPDELSTMTYISYFRTAQERLSKKKADPGKSYAEGPGLKHVNTGDKNPARFTVFSLDEDGNPQAPREKPIEVEIIGPDGKKVDAKIADNKDATYTIEYLPKVPGDYKVMVKLEGKAIKDMPMTVKVGQGADPSKSLTHVSFTIQAFYARGEAKAEGGDLFEVDVTDSSGAEVKATTLDNGDGTYTASYPLEPPAGAKGLWKVSCRLNGSDIPGSPFVHDMNRAE